jgi:hypothetical protein
MVFLNPTSQKLSRKQRGDDAEDAPEAAPAAAPAPPKKKAPGF